MKRKKRYIVTLLLFINIIMLTAAVIPHHHHPNGAICMKQDLPVEQQCPKHHHHPTSDSCCSSECMTRFHSPIPSFHTDSVHRHPVHGRNHRTSAKTTRETGQELLRLPRLAARDEHPPYHLSPRPSLFCFRVRPT